MYEALYARLNLDECAVVSDEDDLAANLVTNLEVRIEVVPRVWSKLLETESDSLLLLVEVENDNLELLVEADNLLRMVDAAPAERGRCGSARREL